MEDWRRQGQESFLMNAHLCYGPYEFIKDEWDHDHCEFCGKKFSIRKEDLNFGYHTRDLYHWICGECFIDFKDDFQWIVDPT